MMRGAFLVGLTLLGGASGCKPNPAPGACGTAAATEDPVCAPSASAKASTASTAAVSGAPR